MITNSQSSRTSGRSEFYSTKLSPTDELLIWVNHRFYNYNAISLLSHAYPGVAFGGWGKSSAEARGGVGGVPVPRPTGERV